MHVVVSKYGQLLQNLGGNRKDYLQGAVRVLVVYVGVLGGGITFFFTAVE